MTIKDLQPARVFEIFHEITQVPRPSKKEEKIRQYLLDFAAKHGLETRTDAVGNVAIFKPATPGHEDAPTLILQGHMDMVCESNDKSFDFENTPITTIVDGEWLHADGTTLGADNGLGCATAMAVLLDDKLVHGPIEALFTVDEEQGLIGANGLQPGFITGSILLNLDSEEHGQLVIGCAGGKVALADLPYTKVEASAGLEFFEVEVDHLKGGHSGMEIGLGRGNSNHILARFLWEVSEQFGLCLVDMDGGNLANAIPRQCKATFGVPADKAEEVRRYAKVFSDMIHAEYLLAEGPDFTFRLDAVEARKEVIDPAVAARLLAVLFGCPNGVQDMSNAVPGLIETSCNLASVKMTDHSSILVTVHIRSSVDSRRDETADRIKALFRMIGAEVTFDDAYVGWAPNPESKVLKVAVDSFRDLFGEEPRVEALHAGLECGLFLEKMPDLDMISFGPTLKDIHSPNEKANIPSVQKYWELVKEMLRRLA